MLRALLFGIFSLMICAPAWSIDDGTMPSAVDTPLPLDSADGVSKLPPNAGIVAPSVPAPSLLTLSIQGTINGNAAPNVPIEITITTPAGNPVLLTPAKLDTNGTYQITFPLAPGNYKGTVTTNDENSYQPSTVNFQFTLNGDKMVIVKQAIAMIGK